MEEWPAGQTASAEASSGQVCGIFGNMRNFAIFM